MVVQIKDYGPPQTEVTITRMDANDTLLRRHRGESFLLSAFRSPLPRLLRLTLLSVLVLASCQQSAKEQPAAADPEPTSQKTADPPSEPELEVPTEPGWLVEVTASSGIDFTYHAYESGSRFMPAIIGAGLALFDADRDGDLDLYLVQGTDLLPSTEKQPDMPNRFFRQESPWQFVDATAESGLGDGGFGIGATTGDFDNDGWTDIYVGNFGPDVLYRNRGDGTFENVTEKAGITVEGFTASCAFADIDRDGDLDLTGIDEGNDDIYVFDNIGPDNQAIFINYLDSWNLVGLPLEVDNPSYLAVFPDAIENTLFSFDEAYIPDSIMIEGDGFWLRFQKIIS